MSKITQTKTEDVHAESVVYLDCNCHDLTSYGLKTYR